MGACLTACILALSAGAAFPSLRPAHMQAATGSVTAAAAGLANTGGADALVVAPALRDSRAPASRQLVGGAAAAISSPYVASVIPIVAIVMVIAGIELTARRRAPVLALGSSAGGHNALAALAVELGLDPADNPTRTATAALAELRSARERVRVLERSRGAEVAALNERMAQLERVKLEFLKLASHELRSPVTVLRGYVSMLEEGALGELPEQMRPVIPILGAKSAEMNLLIDQMLETARLEDSYIALNYERVELHDVVKDAVGTFSREVAARFKVVLQAGLAGVAVRGDRARLVTVVSNLLDNAAKYSPPTSEVRCVLTADRGRAAVVISDYGVGIAATDMPALFTRFGRIVTPENSHIQGTGLGLYLARELARAHGGDVTATSRLGVGSVFMFTLPVAEAG